jgi:ribosomal protein S18 acetylase RimI-like enzyme
MYSIRPIAPADEETIAKILTEQWGDRLSVSRGKMLDASKLPGFIAEENASLIGLITLHFADGECEVVTINAFRAGVGVGRALLARVEQECAEHGLVRLWLITSNDNTEAMAFYQRCGWRLVAVHRNALTEARKLKPQIPLVGHHGIPITDEVELEKALPQNHDK